MFNGSNLKWFALAITSLFYLFEFITRIEPSLASHEIEGFFELSNAGFGALASLFFWVYAPMQLVVGLLLDRFGARRLTLAAILVCSAGVIVFASSSSPIVAGIGRVATGLGASFAFVGALYIVNHWFRPSQFAMLSGAVNAVGMIGTAIGAVALTSVIADAGWRPVFFGTGLAGLCLFLLAAFCLHDRRSDAKADLQPSSFVQPLLVVVRDWRVWLIALIGALYYMPINVFGGLWGNAELSADHDLSPVQAETAVSMIFWGMALGSVTAGWLSDRIGHRKWIIVVGSFLTALSYVLAIYLPSHSLFTISSLLFLAGFFGGGQMLSFAMAKEGHPATISGTVIAFVNMIGIGGALIFQPLIGTIVDMSSGGFGAALTTIPIFLIVAGLLALALSDQRHPDHADR